MASAAFVIKKGKHIDVNLQLILKQMDIVRRDWVRQRVKMVALEHFFFVNCRSKTITILIWEICSFKKVQKCVAKTVLILVLDVYYC